MARLLQLFWGDYDKTHFAENQQNLENHGSDAAPIAEGLEEAIVDADIVMTHFSPIPKYIIEKGKNLKLILTSRGGVEHINVKEASNHNIPVFNVIRNAEPVADFALGLMLDITRNILYLISLLEMDNGCMNITIQGRLNCSMVIW